MMLASVLTLVGASAFAQAPAPSTRFEARDLFGLEVATDPQVSPDGRQVIAAMEGTLSGDIPADGSPADYRRFLVYDRNNHGGYVLRKQIGYQVNPGNRISEVQLYANGKLLVMEAAYSPKFQSSRSHVSANWRQLGIHAGLPMHYR